MNDLSKEQLQAAAKSFELVADVMKQVVAQVGKAIEPIVVAVNKISNDPDFQAAVIEALEQKFDETPEGDVQTRIEIQKQLKVWRKKQNEVRYCAIGDYGVEADFATAAECKAWIKQQVDAAGEDEIDMGEYYTMRTYTPAELAAMPED